MVGFGIRGAEPSESTARDYDNKHRRSQFGLILAYIYLVVITTEDFSKFYS